MVDDPNLRWRTYGHVDFAEVVRHATIHNYHVCFATIPLDLHFVDRGTVALFRSTPRRMSLTVHGNNHTRQELGKPASVEQADRLLAQAVLRTARFEAKHALAVSRVMVPPHEACGSFVLKRLPGFGFEALASTAPWLADVGERCGAAPAGDLLTGFGPAEITMWGMPVLLRHQLGAHDEAILRAFLDQPIILHGHERDFRTGLGCLEDASRVINRRPGVVWADASTLSRSCYLSRRSGAELGVRPFSRRLKVSVDGDVETVVVEPLMRGSRDASETAVPTGGGLVRVADDASTRIAVEARDSAVDLEIELLASSRIEPHQVTDGPRRGRAVVRRMATETRDRARPLAQLMVNR